MRKTGRATSPNVTPHAWVRMDAAGLIRFVSRQAELLFGYDGDDMCGRSIPDLELNVGPVDKMWVFCG